MGAWGVGTFENDDASDWVYQLEEAGDLDLVEVTLQAAADPEAYLEAPSVKALDQVAADSELKELWAESEERGAWVDRLQELRARLVT